MAAKKMGTPAAEAPTTWENPLIPNRKLRQLYTAMVELRLLEEHVVRLQRRAKAAARLHVAPGEEGCRVSTALSLMPGDLISDAATGVATEFLRGARLAELIHRVYALSSGATPMAEPHRLKGVPPGFPIVERGSDRLHVAIGASFALASKKSGSLMVVYVHGTDLSLAEWKPILRLAGAQAAPILFVVIPDPAQAKRPLKPGLLSHTATLCGVPGIPVDGADPVALYRVTQESMLRARAGGGPVLMECIPFQLPGKKATPGDPIRTMREFLLHRNVVTDAWMEGVATRFAARLQAAEQ